MKQVDSVVFRPLMFCSSGIPGQEAVFLALIVYFALFGEKAPGPPFLILYITAKCCGNMKHPSMEAILYKAMDNAREGITISDATQPDNPLIYVNQGFLTMTGYSYAESIGRNCNYLQGKDTSADDVQKIRQAIKERQPVQVELLNYRKNGQPFLNCFSLTPVLDENETLLYFIGVQDDITITREKKKVEDELARRKLITQATIAAQEEQRQQVDRELHDNINQMIATIKLYMEMAAKYEHLREDMIHRTRELTGNIIKETRRLSKFLVGPAFKYTSFKMALGDLVASLQPAISFTITINDEGLKEEGLSTSQKLILYRILQEQFNNILKYAKAEGVFVRLETEAVQTRLSIRDDGIGFDASLTNTGIGLRNISNRLEVENGNLQLITAPGAGCELIACLPHL